MPLQPILIAGAWRAADSIGAFQARNPTTGDALPDQYPVSSWSDCDAALDAASSAAALLRRTPADTIARFLERFADRMDRRKAELVEQAHLETALPKAPRLAEGEFPRTTSQLRQAAAAARDGSWALPTIDTKNNIRSCLSAIGPVAVFGPNNFPFAFNGAAGGDFAAAIAAGNPVIAKGHPLHPGTTRMLAEEALASAGEIGLPPATIQLLYRIAPESGARLVSDRRIGATAFTGGRAGGLALKSAADAKGKPIYLEMSSINPVVILPGALAERGAKVAEEFASSCMLGGGQFCTNPGLIVLLANEATEQFITAVSRAFDAGAPPPLLSASVATGLAETIQVLEGAGARIITADDPTLISKGRHSNTLLRVSGHQFLAQPEKLQSEAFGAAALLVVTRDAQEAAQVLEHLEGNLTGSIYSDSAGADEALYAELAPMLRERVGRFLNDKMPTGVAVSPAMNHGGPFPATGHPGFTAVGVPASMRRFGALHCYENVRQSRLPALLRDENPDGRTWRSIDGQWTQAACGLVSV